MSDDRKLPADLAAAVLDGTAIDWIAAEATAGEADRPLLGELRVLAALAEFHRSLPPNPSAAAPAPSLQPSTDWGPLKILEPAGRGAFGEVYLAWDTRLDREVALKLLPAPRAIGTEPASSIIQEGRLLARVRHPNIATIYGAEQINGRIGLWMEFIRGRTLKQQIDEGRAFDEQAVVEIGLALCEAVGAVHRAGLLHRDIKAQNVMQADDGRIVLMDFGTGRELEDRAASDLAGTPLYLAPEVLEGGAATVRSDIYSLGVLLHYLATGSHPVEAKNVRELRAAHADATLARSRSRGLAGPLARILERATDRQPERRYPSMSAFATDLATRVRSRSATLRRHIAVAAAAAAVLVASLALGWRLLGVAGPATSPRGGSFDQPIIAVLPFENHSAEPDSDLFVDGLTDEVIRNLAVIDGLEVRSRTSAFTFKGKPRNLREVAQQLGANFVVEGSVLRVGRQLRINVQLIQVAGDVTLWSNRFDRQLEDVFAIQDDISRAIANELRLTLGRGQRRYDTNADVYELFLRGRALLERRGIPSLEQAADTFQRVVALDPAFAPAHAGLALAYALISAPVSSTITLDAAQPTMRRSAARALELDPLLADAHAAAGWVYARENDWTLAEGAFRRAMAINPSLTVAYTSYSISTLQPLGRLQEGLQVLEGALRNDPLSLDVQREIGAVQLLSGQYEDAIATLRRITIAEPDFPFASMYLARALTFAGRASEALPLLEALDGRGLGRFKPLNMPRAPWLAQAYVVMGRRADAEALAVAHKDSPVGFAIVSAALGDNDRAFGALERLAAVQPHNIGRLLLFPEMRSLKGDPRLASLQKRLKLPVS